MKPSSGRRSGLASGVLQMLCSRSRMQPTTFISMQRCGYVMQLARWTHPLPLSEQVLYRQAHSAHFATQMSKLEFCIHNKFMSRVVSGLASRISSIIRAMPVPTRPSSPPTDLPAAKRARLSLSPRPAVSDDSTAPETNSTAAEIKPSRKMKAKLQGAAEAHQRAEAAKHVEPDDVLRARVEEIMGEPIEIPKQYAYELDYRNKLVLAPMVRTGTLPMRLLSLYYGAGLVWSPEIVDKAIIGAERTVCREYFRCANADDQRRPG